MARDDYIGLGRREEGAGFWRALKLAKLGLLIWVAITAENIRAGMQAGQASPPTEASIETLEATANLVAISDPSEVTFGTLGVNATSGGVSVSAPAGCTIEASSVTLGGGDNAGGIPRNESQLHKFARVSNLVDTNLPEVIRYNAGDLVPNTFPQPATLAFDAGDDVNKTLTIQGWDQYWNYTTEAITLDSSGEQNTTTVWWYPFRAFVSGPDPILNDVEMRLGSADAPWIPAETQQTIDSVSLVPPNTCAEVVEVFATFGNSGNNGRATLEMKSQDVGSNVQRTISTLFLGEGFGAAQKFDVPIRIGGGGLGRYVWAQMSDRDEVGDDFDIAVQYGIRFCRD